MMKNIKSFALLILIGVVSCSEDESPAYKFKDQDASGKIDNVEWTYADGYADTDSFIAGEVAVTLTLSQTAQGCAMDFPEGDMVFFSVPAETGIYKLKFDFSSSTGNRTVTLFKESETLNIIATEGAVEVISISDTQISGRLDARAYSDSYINGNFTVSICL